MWPPDTDEQKQALKPASIKAFAIDGVKKYISKVAEIPDDSISIIASFVPQYMSDSVSLAYMGKITLYSQSISTISSAAPRKTVIGECECAFLNAGISSDLPQSISDV